MSAKDAAKTALTVAAPELAVPVDVVSSLLKKRDHGAQHVEVSSTTDMIVAPPRPFLVTRKEHFTTKRVGGRTIVVFHPASGLSTGQTAGALLLLAAAVGAYEAAKAVNTDVQKITHPQLSLPNPLAAVGL